MKRKAKWRWIVFDRKDNKIISRHKGYAAAEKSAKRWGKCSAFVELDSYKDIG